MLVRCCFLSLLVVVSCLLVVSVRCEVLLVRVCVGCRCSLVVVGC